MEKLKSKELANDPEENKQEEPAKLPKDTKEDEKIHSDSKRQKQHSKKTELPSDTKEDKGNLGKSKDGHGKVRFEVK
jgi:hypothetical protein